MEEERFYESAAEQLLQTMLRTRALPMRRRAMSLPQGEKGVLLYLFDREGRVTTPGEISRDLGVGSGGVANALNALERRGYVTRAASPADRRRVVVTISETGRELIRQRRREALESTAALLKALGREDAEDLLRLSRRIAEIGNALREPEDGE